MLGTRCHSHYETRQSSIFYLLALGFGFHLFPNSNAGLRKTLPPCSILWNPPWFPRSLLEPSFCPPPGSLLLLYLTRQVLGAQGFRPCCLPYSEGRFPHGSLPSAVLQRNKTKTRPFSFPAILPLGHPGILTFWHPDDNLNSFYFHNLADILLFGHTDGRYEQLFL